MIAVAVCAAAPTFAHAVASLTWVGAYPTGGVNTETRGISGDGSTAIGGGNPDPVSNSSTQAFRWTSAGGLVTFGAANVVAPRGINQDGSVIVGVMSASGGGAEAFRWTQANGFAGLGDLPGGPVYSEANAVSSDGSVVVGQGRTDTTLFEAFRWTQSGGMTPLGDLDGGTFESSAIAVSRDGNVIVGYGQSANGQEAMRWTQAGGMVGLGDLPGGDFTSYSTGANEDGSVIVGAAFGASGQRAFRWTQAGGMVPLGTLPTNELNPYSYATAISADGYVVVGSSSSFNGGVDSDTEAYVWTSGSGMVRLWDVLQANGANPAADGWTRLLTATSISDDGTTITGYGYRNDHTEGFVAVLPEPGSIGVALITLVATPQIRRRRKF
jgi:probable HAF family extracellular repeat protein